MVSIGCEVYGKFLRVRNDPKTNSTTFLRKSGLLRLRKEYQPTSFFYLKGTLHIDSDSLLPYRVSKVYVRRGSIVCDRHIYQIGDALSHKKPKIETIHAMDIVLYTLISNPRLLSPLLESGESLGKFLLSLKSDSTHVSSSKGIAKHKKRAREEQPSSLDSKTTVGKTIDPRIKSVPQNFDPSAKLRRSNRLKVLSTKVYVIRDRKEVDNVESIHAEDIFIPKNHHQAMHTGFSIYWTKAEKSETDGLKTKDTYELVDEINLPPGTKIIPGSGSMLSR